MGCHYQISLITFETECETFSENWIKITFQFAICWNQFFEIYPVLLQDDCISFFCRFLFFWSGKITSVNSSSQLSLLVCPRGIQNSHSLLFGQITRSYRVSVCSLFTDFFRIVLHFLIDKWSCLECEHWVSLVNTILPNSFSIHVPHFLVISWLKPMQLKAICG